MNCKPGDMAVTVNMLSPDRNGIIVNVLRRYNEGEIVSGVIWNTEGSISWVCESIGSPISYGNKFTKSGLAMVRPISDDRLRPIRPDETPEQSLEAMRLLTQIPVKEKA